MTPFPLQAAVGSPDVAMALAVLAGFGFGFMLEKAGFGDPRRLVRQFFGSEMIMLKVMFSAVATTVLLTAILHGLGAIDLPALGRLVATPTFLWPMIAGGLLIGAGIAFSGYCPGTDFVGIASGKRDAFVVYGGVIVGQVVAGELDHWGAWRRFFASGAKGQLFLYDLLGVPAAVLALAIALVAIGAFLLGEWVERKVAGAAAPPSPARPKRLVFGALAGAGLVAVVTLALPFGAKAGPRAAGRIAVEELARRVFERPWDQRVIDVRGAEPCGAARIPGAECVAAAEVARLGLDLEPASRDLVFVGAGDLPEPPPGAMAFPGRVLILAGGFEAWRGWALTAPTPPAATAPLEEQDAWRLRAGVYAAMTGVKPAAPTAPAAGGAAPARKKVGGGGSGCGG
ncbi:MAG TPA: YeeE/YedE thiosulfate transporter family protein [Anaeromyxobacteraceae bacterium]|nr:YeeE/YedE thiosulfate transporter family protein [Anaeromyxobacteraceae bacterium]